MRLAEIETQKPLEPLDAQAAAMANQSKALKKQKAQLRVRKAQQKLQKAQQQAHATAAG